MWGPYGPLADFRSGPSEAQQALSDLGRRGREDGGAGVLEHATDQPSAYHQALWPSLADGSGWILDGLAIIKCLASVASLNGFALLIPFALWFCFHFFLILFVLVRLVCVCNL